MSGNVTDKDILKSAETLIKYCDSFGNECKDCIIYKSGCYECDICNLDIDNLKSYVNKLDTDKENTEEVKTEILNDDIDNTDTTNEQSKTYKDGLNDAWEYIKKLLLNISANDYMKIFNGNNLNYILQNYSLDEVIGKIKEWEKSQIQVGDEIISTISNAKGVITYMCSLDKKVYILWEDGTCEETIEVDDLKKTGRNLKQELDNMLKTF